MGQLKLLTRIGIRYDKIGIIIILIAMIPTSVEAQIPLDNDLTFTGIKIYAIPATSRTRRPLHEQDIKKYSDIVIIVKDEYVLSTILKSLGNLEERSPIKYDNVRINCEIYKQGSLATTFSFHVGGIVSIGKNYYHPNEKLHDQIWYYLPEDFR
ncbi:MAG: hypothetical protein AAFY76_12390 [Cyanobacteria bacterium J06649_11]